jgi:hypothetical protein
LIILLARWVYRLISSIKSFIIIKNQPIFPFVYLGGSSGIILCSTLGPCKTSVKWSTGSYNFVRYRFSKRIRVFFMQEKGLLSNSPRMQSTFHSASGLVTTPQILKVSDKRPFSCTYAIFQIPWHTHTCLGLYMGRSFCHLPIHLLSIVTSHFVMIMIWVIGERFF